MKRRSHDGLAAKGLLEILCRILIMLMVGRQCNIQNKRAFLNILGHFLVLQDLTTQLINKESDNCQKRKDNRPLICIKTVAQQLPRIIRSAIPRSIVIIIILTVVRPTNGGLSESVELGSFIFDLNQLCQADFKIINFLNIRTGQAGFSSVMAHF